MRAVKTHEVFTVGTHVRALDIEAGGSWIGSGAAAAGAAKRVIENGILTLLHGVLLIEKMKTRRECLPGWGYSLSSNAGPKPWTDLAR